MARRLAAPEVTDRTSFLKTGVVILAVIGVAGALFGGPPISPPGPVLVVGDSLFYSAADELQAAMAEDGWETRIEAYPGSGIQGGGYTDLSWPTYLRDITRQNSYEVAVVELGTNGCDGCSSIRAAIDDVMRSLTDVEVVLWLDVRTDAPRPGAEMATEINEELYEAPERWGNLRVVPYSDWVDEPGLVDTDGVHLTPAGQLVLTGQLRGHLRDLADIDP
jgi:hypothetical protein